MKHAFLTLAAAAAVAVPSTLSAQCTGFDPQFGTNLAMGLDQTSLDSTGAALVLPFPFLSPGGATWTNVDMDSHGRVFASAADTSDWDPTVADFLTLDAINIGWTDMSVGSIWGALDPNHNCYYFADATKAVFTWFQMQPYQGGVSFDLQLILRPDNSFSMIYGGSFPSIPPFTAGNPDAIIGTSDGISPDPGVVDFSAASQSSTNGTLYETYGPAFGGLVDLTGKQLDWFPTGGPGAGYVTIVSDCPFAGVTESPQNCDGGTPEGPSGGFDFFPDGSGGWIAVPGVGAYDSVNLGTSMGLGDETIATQSLGFSWTWPGGTASTDCDVQSNGLIFPGASGVVPGASLYTVNPANWLGFAAPAIGLWCDVNPSLLAGDALFYTDGANRANITWTTCPQFGETNELTWQIQINSDGSWSVYYLSISEYNPASAFPGMLIGTSGGAGALDPGEMDLNGISPPASAGDPTLYEHFDQAIPENQDLQAAANPIIMDANASNNPVIGAASFDTDVAGIPATAASAAVLMGLPQPVPLPLNLVPLWPNVNCTLYTDGTIFSSPIPGWTPGQTTGAFSISMAGASIALSGFQFTIQYAAIDVSLPWATELPVILSSGLECTVGL